MMDDIGIGVGGVRTRGTRLDTPDSTTVNKHTSVNRGFRKKIHEVVPLPSDVYCKEPRKTVDP